MLTAAAGAYAWKIGALELCGEVQKTWMKPSTSLLKMSRVSQIAHNASLQDLGNNRYLHANNNLRHNALCQYDVRSSIRPKWGGVGSIETDIDFRDKIVMRHSTPH